MEQGIEHNGQIIILPLAKDVEFLPVNAAPKDQVCNLCGRRLRGSFSAPRQFKIKVTEQRGFIFYACSAKCSKAFKSNPGSNEFMRVKALECIINSESKNDKTN